MYLTRNLNNYLSAYKGEAGRSDALSLLGNLTTHVVHSLVREKTIKEWYSTAEVASLVGKAEYTVREWCRQGRVRATKKSYARGSHPEWLIAHDELTRLRSEGLLPAPDRRPTDDVGAGCATAVSRTPGR